MNHAAGAFSFGEELRSCQLDGIRISETLVPAGLRLAEHAHEPGQICFILEGEYRERTGRQQHSLGPGRLQFHAPGERHSNVFSSESDILTLLISIDPSRWLRLAAPRPVRPDVVLHNCSREIRRELGRVDEAARAALEAWSMLSLALVARGRHDLDEREPAWLEEAVSVIARKMGEHLSLGSLAREVGVHRATLAAAFRRFRKTSVGQFIRAQRVRQVRHALRMSNRPLCEIATEVGFHDQAHMNRVFREATGTSPGAYRAARR